MLLNIILKYALNSLAKRFVIILFTGVLPFHNGDE